jgi:peptide/nickel transport system substrate-binding protein
MSKKLLNLLLVVMMLAVLVPTTLAAPPAQEEGQDYVVVADDWLSKLADKYLGNPMAYPAIVHYTNQKHAEDASYAEITNPDLIEVGWKIYIPSAAEAEAYAGPAAAEAMPAKGELSNVLTAAHSEYAFTFEPTFCNWSDVGRICVTAYDALVKFDPTIKQIVPWVAKEWEVSDGGLTYTFKINEGIKFHDGSDLTASDVKYTFDRLIALDDGVANVLYVVESVEVVDDYTVEIKLNMPSAAFLASMPLIFIISEDGVKANEVDGDWGQTYMMENDLGSGPYMLASSIPEQQAVFVKFDGYWQGWEGKHLDGVTFLWIKESATQRLMVENGELDISMEPSSDDLAAWEADPNYQVLSAQSPVVFYVAFRVTHPPLDDPRVRKALAMAVDYDYHIEVALAGYGQRARGPLSSALPYHNDEIEFVPYDLEAAKALLADAGYPDGGFTLKVAYESAQAEKQRAMEMLQANWGELGVEIEPIGVDYMAQEAMQQDEGSEPDVYLHYIWPSAAEPDVALRPNFHGDLKGVFGDNASFWSDPEVDRLFDEGIVETDPAKREAIYREIQQRIVDATSGAWITENPFNIVANNYVKGYVYNPAIHQSLDVYNMWLEGKP